MWHFREIVDTVQRLRLRCGDQRLVIRVLHRLTFRAQTSKDSWIFVFARATVAAQVAFAFRIVITSYRLKFSQRLIAEEAENMFENVLIQQATLVGGFFDDQHSYQPSR